MTMPGGGQADYEAAKARLTARLAAGLDRSMRAQRFKARRAELQGVADQLRELASRVEDGPAWSDLEQSLDQQADPSAALKDIAGSMRDLAAAADAAAKDYRDPRRKPILPWAALVFLHIRYRHGLALPTNYSGHPAVVEFADLLAAAAGGERGPDYALTLLKAALKEFDRFMPPEGADEFL